MNNPLSTIIYDNHEVVYNRLKKSPPTFVFSTEKGLYIFADKIEKVHSNIILAGTGSDFKDVVVWFANQIATLSREWARNVPCVESEIKLLPQLFRVNNSMARMLCYADMVVMELAEDSLSDYIYRVDFTGEITRFYERTVYVSYQIKPATLSSEERRDSDSKKTQEHDFKKDLNIASFEELKNGGWFTLLKENYRGERCFLNRNEFLNKNYQWIYEKI